MQVSLVQSNVEGLMVALQGARQEVSATAAAANREREASRGALHAAQEVRIPPFDRIRLSFQFKDPASTTLAVP